MRIVRLKSSYIEPYPLQVVGEASYRDEIEEIVGFVDDEEGVNDDSFWAHLILDDLNRYDRGNAVAVEINGKTIGYLLKADARIYRKRLKELGLEDITGECHASIKGGFTKPMAQSQILAYGSIWIWIHSRSICRQNQHLF